MVYTVQTEDDVNSGRNHHPAQYFGSAFVTIHRCHPGLLLWFFSATIMSAMSSGLLSWFMSSGSPCIHSCCCLGTNVPKNCNWAGTNAGASKIQNKQDGVRIAVFTAKQPLSDFILTDTQLVVWLFCLCLGLGI